MMKMVRLAFLATLLAVALTAQIAPAQSYENSSVIGQVPDRVVITVRPGTEMALEKSDAPVKVGVPSIDALADRFAVTGMEPMYKGMTTNFRNKADWSVFDRVWAVDFPAHMDIHEVKTAYESLPEVEEVRLVDICKQYDAWLPNDVTSAQYYLRNLNQGGASIRAVGAWNQALGDSNVVVAVIDSGVDWHHPDLGGTHPDKVNGAIWTNWTEYYGTPGVDDDSNGKTDDIRGWDFVNVSASAGWPDEDVTTADNDPMDYESHGTACAGCVAAITDNGTGIAGTAPGCKIMALRAGYLPNGETLGIVRMDFVSQAILYAANNGADIINCSWGSSAYIEMAVNAAISEGLLLITAAGNDNVESDPSYLGTKAGVLAVAATGSSDAKASFSSFGTWVELAAPGVNIYTTYYNSTTDESTYASVDGTSFSSPITAGAAALLWSANPGMTASQIATLLTSSCDNIDDVNPSYVGLLGAGRVNMLKALGDTQHRYPTEFPTLFDAINEAGEGDEIAVQGGVTLGGNITILNRGLQVNGGYSTDFSTRDPLGNPSIISGNLGETGLKFEALTDNTTVVDGFRIQDCGGVNYSGIPYVARYGGGISLNYASPTLRNLVITGNAVGDTGDLGCGGGLNANGSSAILENVTITGNTAVYGGGLFSFNSDLTLTDCSITDNTLITDNFSYAPLGGGIHNVDSDLTMTNCTVSGHLEASQGGGVYSGSSAGESHVVITDCEISGNSAKDNGGGVYHTSGSLTMTGAAVTGNTKSATATFMYGGGIYATAATADLDSLTVTGNEAQFGGGVMLIGCPQADISHTLLYDNTALYYGGGLDFENNTAGSIVSNTVTGNSGPGAGGGGIYVNGCAPAVSNNISAFNTGGVSFANGITLLAGASSLTCNDAFGNDTDWGGVADPTGIDGNISADPQFCDVTEGDFTIPATSACAPDQTGSCGLIGAFADDCSGNPVPDEPGAVPLAFQVERNFPNPFNPKTTIRFTLPESGLTRVAIYDVAGRLVRTLVNTKLEAQSHEISWAGRDDSGRTVSAGVYFYQVTSGDHQAVGRMALVK